MRGHTTDGQLEWPCSISADAHGAMLVLDYGSRRLQVLKNKFNRL
jgi:hypothetical protein